MIRKAQPFLFLSLSLTFVKTPLYYYFRAKKKPKCLKERDENPLKPPLDKDRRDIITPIMGLEEQYSSRPMAGSRDVHIHHSCVFISFLLIFLSLFRQKWEMSRHNIIKRFDERKRRRKENGAQEEETRWWWW